MHTDPRGVRAARRLGSPRTHRSEGDASTRMRVGRALKQSGISYSFETNNPRQFIAWPRIVIHRPSHGFFHPATQQQVQEILMAVGSIGVYGLKSVELSRQSDVEISGSAVLARYIAPDRIVLFEQQRPPWHFIGRIPDPTRELFEKSGAEIRWSADASVTIVGWPSDTLAHFLLAEGLLHEIGHHIKQHEARAGNRRIARTRDHEAFASNFASRLKRDLLVEGSSV